MKISLATRYTTPILLTMIAVTSALFLGAILHSAAANGSGTITATPASFTNYELAGNPFVTNHSTGVTWHNQDASYNNTEREPAIRGDKQGNFYLSSEQA